MKDQPNQLVYLLRDWLERVIGRGTGTLRAQRVAPRRVATVKRITMALALHLRGSGNCQTRVTAMHCHEAIRNKSLERQTTESFTHVFLFVFFRSKGSKGSLGVENAV